MKKLLFIFAAVMCTNMVFAGIIYEASMETEIYNQQEYQSAEDNPAAGMMEEMTKPYSIKVMAEAGGKARVKFLSDAAMMFTKDSFIVTNDGKIMYICDPESKTYSKLDTDAMLKGATQMMESLQKFTKMKYSDISVTIADLGDGGNVAGHSTTKYKLVVEYTTEMKILFKKVKQKNRSEYILYTTKDFDFSMLGEYGNSTMFSTGIADIDTQIKAKVNGLGLPLKTETLAYDKDNALMSKHSMTITSIQEKSLNSKLFDLPGGYTEKEMEIQTTDEDGNPEKQKMKLGDLFK